MSVDAIAFIPAGTRLESLAGAEASKAYENFAGWFESQMVELNSQLEQGDAALRTLATGEATNLHHVMISMEKAMTSFQLTLQVRNKLLEGYQEIMRMQV